MIFNCQENEHFLASKYQNQKNKPGKRQTCWTILLKKIHERKKIDIKKCLLTIAKLFTLWFFFKSVYHKFETDLRFYNIYLYFLNGHYVMLSRSSTLKSQTVKNYTLNLSFLLWDRVAFSSNKKDSNNISWFYMKINIFKNSKYRNHALNYLPELTF